MAEYLPVLEKWKELVLPKEIGKKLFFDMLEFLFSAILPEGTERNPLILSCEHILLSLLETKVSPSGKD